jgi:hypothetical protein
MLSYNHFLIVGLGDDSQIGPPTHHGDHSSISVTIVGKTYRYTSPQSCSLTERKPMRLWYVDMGGAPEHFLSIATCGVRSGSFSFGETSTLQSGISIVTYGYQDSIYSSYPPSDYAQSRLKGIVHIEHQEGSYYTKGTFSGFLRPHHQLSDTKATPISGQFSLYRQQV